MKTIVKRFMAIFGLLALFSAFASAAANASVPGIDGFVDVLIGLAGGKVGLFIIIVVMGFSGYNAWKNANIAALLWGLFASLLIAVLVPFATKLIDWANSGAILG